jgi:hypothetical protein
MFRQTNRRMHYPKWTFPALIEYRSFNDEMGREFDSRVGPVMSLRWCWLTKGINPEFRIIDVMPVNSRMVDYDLAVKLTSGLFRSGRWWHRPDTTVYMYTPRHERTTTAKNMGILKYHQTSLISYERGWPLACMGGLIKPGLPSGCQVDIKCFYAKSTSLALIIETSAVWPWCRRSFQDICRGLWIIIAELTCGLFPMIFRMVFPSWKHFIVL